MDSVFKYFPDRKMIKLQTIDTTATRQFSRQNERWLTGALLCQKLRNSLRNSRFRSRSRLRI